MLAVETQCIASLSWLAPISESVCCEAEINKSEMENFATRHTDYKSARATQASLFIDNGFKLRINIPTLHKIIQRQTTYLIQIIPIEMHLRYIFPACIIFR